MVKRMNKKLMQIGIVSVFPVVGFSGDNVHYVSKQ